MLAQQKKEDRERILKFVLCAILGLGTGRLIGYPTTPTIAVSAILMLYIDRGYTGALRYSWRRVQTQVLMGALACALIWLLRLVPFLQDWMIGILTTVALMAVGLNLHYRHPIAPLSVTLGNAALIMTTGILTNTAFFPQRVLFCLLGALIGHGVNFWVFRSPDRLKLAWDQLREDAAPLLAAAQRAGGGASGRRASAAFVEKQLDFLKEDSRWRHQPAEPWRLERLTALLAAERHLIALEEDLARWGRDWSEEFSAAYLAGLDRGQAAHQVLLDSIDAAAEPACLAALDLRLIPAATPGECILAADLTRYLDCLSRAR